MRSLDDVLARVEKLDNAAQLQPIEAEITALGDGLNVLAEVVSGLQVDDAAARTKILEDISTAFAHHGRVRATYASVRKQLLTREGKAEFGAQFKLFAQTVASALRSATRRSSATSSSRKLLVQLEELSGRFAEFDEFLGELAAKREEVHDAIAARKQTLLDERQARVQSLVAAAERILEGVGRRAQTLQGARRAQRLLRGRRDGAQGQGAGREADGPRRRRSRPTRSSSKIISARQDALRALRDRRSCSRAARRSSSSAPSSFTVNTQPLDVTLLARGDQMAIHLGGTDFFEPIDDPEFDKTREYWNQQIVSETEQVYRGEYLAATVLAAAEAGEKGLDLARLYAAEREPGGLARARAQIRGRALRRGLRARRARRRRRGDPREAARAARQRGAAAGARPRRARWPACSGPTRGTASRGPVTRGPRGTARAQSVARLRLAFRFTPAAAALASELSTAIQAFLDSHGLARSRPAMCTARAPTSSRSWPPRSRASSPARRRWPCTRAC